MILLGIIRVSLELVTKFSFFKFRLLSMNVPGNLTTIPVDLRFLWHFEILKLKTCSLYQEKLLMRKVNDMNTQVVKSFFFASDIIIAVRGHF